ncbi:MAG: hypothetical protein O3A63_14700 [Proteobacteria bacterium]|nr:hypothetical protein [Pseudomonadota bacterium]
MGFRKRSLWLLLLSVFTPAGLGHGGVVLEDDVCVINIGFLKAHFTSYQPETQGAEEFCEDIPDVAGSVFVIDYLHDFLKSMPVDFRIIHDINDLGRFANWDDVKSIGDLNPHTVFYDAARTHSDGVLKIEHAFAEAGSYIGVVTAQHPTEDKRYNAVFQFRVGGADYGFVPYMIALMLFLHLMFWKGGDWMRRLIKAG